MNIGKLDLSSWWYPPAAPLSGHPSRFVSADTKKRILKPRTSLSCRSCCVCNRRRTVADLQHDQQIRLPVLIRPCEHVIRDQGLKRERAGDDMSNDGAHYQPVAWWFTKRLLGRELRNPYQPAEHLPPQLHALVRKLEGKPNSSPEPEGEGCGSSGHQ